MSKEQELHPLIGQLTGAFANHEVDKIIRTWLEERVREYEKENGYNVRPFNQMKKEKLIPSVNECQNGDAPPDSPFAVDDGEAGAPCNGSNLMLCSGWTVPGKRTVVESQGAFNGRIRRVWRPGAGVGNPCLHSIINLTRGGGGGGSGI